MDAKVQQVTQTILAASHVWLFLDYDGTLAEFAPTPDDIDPKPEIIHLVRGLAVNPLLRVSVISGRRLEHVRHLVPVEGIILAGTYGIEYVEPSGEIQTQIPYQNIRPTLDWLKPQIEMLLSGKEGFFLEDKGWSLAIHAKFARTEDAVSVLRAARTILRSIRDPSRFRILDGDRFLEIGPQAANKGMTVQWLIGQYPSPDSLLVFVGDDDKDEEAFEVIHRHKGLAVVVAPEPRPTRADARLTSPREAREWLQSLLNEFNQRVRRAAIPDT